MSDLYFSCEWIVSPLKTASRGTGGALMDIYTIVTDLGCQVILGESKTWNIPSDGYHIFQFMLRVPSQERLDECLNALHDYLQFTNIQPATGDELVGDPHAFVLSAGMTDIIEVIEEMGEHNARINAG
jgi:hypothetical protein